MSSIDERVVGMRFDNKQFEAGTRDTISMLDRLKGALKLDGVGSELDQTSSKFSAFNAVAFSALQRLTNSAIDFGQKIAGAVLDPLIEGGQRRALNIEQARFQFEGLGMDVEKSMDSALAAVKGTAYGLDEAAVVAAQFGASGMEAGDDMTKALLGISGVAAMAGASYSDIGSVFTKVAGQGRLMGDDLNRLAVRGVNAAATLVDYFKETGKHANITEADIRKMVTKGEIDFQTFADAMSDAFGEHATKANETYSGSLSNMRAAISRVGAEFAASKFESQRQIFNALAPAIDKVFTALKPVMSLYADMTAKNAQRIVAFIDGLDFSDVTRGIAIFVTGLRFLFKAANAYLVPLKGAFNEVFPSADGAKTITNLATAFRNLMLRIQPGAETLERVRVAAVAFFSGIRIGLAILKTFGRVAWDAIKTVASALGALFGFLTPVTTGITDLFSSFSDNAGGVDGIVASIESFGDKIIELRKAGIDPIIDSIKALASSFQGFLKGLNFKGVDEFGVSISPLKSVLNSLSDAWDSFTTKLTTKFAPAIEGMTGFWGKLVSVIQGAWKIIKAVGGFIGDVFANVVNAIGGGLGNINAENLMTGISIGMLGSIAVAIKKFLDSFQGISGIGQSVKDVIGGISGVFSAMQKDIQAGALLKIAAAIGILALSIMMLTYADTGDLIASATTIATAAGILLGGLKAMTAIMSSKSILEMQSAAIALVIFATAMTIMASAIKKLSSLSWGELAVGLTGMAVAMAGMVAASVLMSKYSGSMIRAAVAMNFMSLAIYGIAGAIAIFGLMPLDVLIQGGVAFIAIIGAMTLVAMLLSKVGPKMFVAAVGLMAMATAINLLLIPITALGFLPLDVLVQGMVAVGILLAGLTIFALALGLVAPQMVLASLGLIAMAIAINLLVLPITALAYLPFELLIQGLIGLTAALAVMVAAALLMSGGVAGAAGMLLMSVAILALAVSLGILSAIGLVNLAVAIGALVVALTVLGLAALILTPVIPALLGLSASLLVLGVAMVVITGALLIFTMSLMMLAAIGLPGLAVALGALVIGLTALGLAAMLLAPVVPMMFLLAGALATLGASILLIGAGLAILGAGLMLLGMFGAVGVTALTSFVKALTPLIKHIPAIALMAGAFTLLGAATLILGVGLLAVGVGALAAAIGLTLLGVVGYLAASGTNSFSRALERIIPMTADILSLANNIRKLGTSMRQVGIHGRAAANGMLGLAAAMQQAHQAMIIFVMGISKAGSAIQAGLASVSIAIRSQTSSIGRSLNLLVNLIANFANDLRAQGTIIAAAGLLMMMMLVQSISSSQRILAVETRKISEVFVQMAVAIGQTGPRMNREASRALSGLRRFIINTLNNMRNDLRTSGRTVGEAIAAGMASGIRNNRSSVTSAATSVANAALSSSRAALEIRSPSRKGYEIGRFFDLGIANGMASFSGHVSDTAGGVANDALDQVREVMSDLAKRLEEGEFDQDFNPVITPTLDLSQVRDQAQMLSGLLSQNDSVPVNPLEYVNAVSASQDRRNERENAPEESEREVGDVIFNQVNNSPKALDEITIYRNTHNLLATVRRRINEGE